MRRRPASACNEHRIARRNDAVERDRDALSRPLVDRMDAQVGFGRVAGIPDPSERLAGVYPLPVADWDASRAEMGEFHPQAPRLPRGRAGARVLPR